MKQGQKGVKGIAAWGLMVGEEVEDTEVVQVLFWLADDVDDGWQANQETSPTRCSTWGGVEIRLGAG
ncbi:hypothetical protein TWF718_008586 [Orbilia javanica]|uniref:Uncharacterized protein n=1 Tax=Orbilia javanica TaxID=47235 RepID=A0AAN8MQN8_9PEZI